MEDLLQALNSNTIIMAIDTKIGCRIVVFRELVTRLRQIQKSVQQLFDNDIQQSSETASNRQERTLGFKSRKIKLEENDQTIEVNGYLAKDKSTTVLELYVNGELQDSLTSTPKQGIFGCTLLLNGTLRNNVPVRVKLEVHFFMRPKYTFLVNQEIVFEKKGTWGGI